MALVDLPADVLAECSTLLSITDLGHLLLSSKALSSGLLEEQAFWAAQCRKRWPRDTQPRAAGSSWRSWFLHRHNACVQFNTRDPGVLVFPPIAVPQSFLMGHIGDGVVRVSFCGTTAVAAHIKTLYVCHRDGTRNHLTNHTGRITCMDSTVVEDQRLVVTGSADQTLWQYSAPQDDKQWNPRQQKVLRGHKERVDCVKILQGISTGGAGVTVSGSADSTLRVWPALARKGHSAVLRGHGAGVRCLVDCPGLGLCSGSADQKVKVWDLVRGTSKATARLTGTVHDMLAMKEQPSTVLCAVAAQSEMQAVDFRVPGGVTAASTTGEIRCMAHEGHTLLTGHATRACMWDLRMLGSSGRIAMPMCQLWAPRGSRLETGVNTCHLDRHKAVIAVHCWGMSCPEAPLHVHDTATGAHVASFWSDRPSFGAMDTPGRMSGESYEAHKLRIGDSASAELSAGSAAGAAEIWEGRFSAGAKTVPRKGDSGCDEAAGEDHDDSEEGDQKQRLGITAVCCDGPRLLTGNADGVVVVRDFSQGLPHSSSAATDSDVGHSKFWNTGRMP